MDILDKLRRAVEQHRRTCGVRPNRIVLKGEAAQQMADSLARCEKDKMEDIKDFYKKTGDEMFLDGDVCYFKRIPVIAELKPSEVLIVGFE